MTHWMFHLPYLLLVVPQVSWKSTCETMTLRSTPTPKQLAVTLLQTRQTNPFPHPHALPWLPPQTNPWLPWLPPQAVFQAVFPDLCPNDCLMHPRLHPMPCSMTLPSRLQVHFRTAQLLQYHLRDYEGAERSYQACLGIAPAHAEALAHYGLLLCNSLRQYSSARKVHHSL